ncbi:MAG: hypothetical protein LBK61_14430 [Spirochaetaceae bacterium]|jgi:hypothetical protein|nr:hypothetical protein [Spirochaetaceae bacterium]
MYKRTIDLMEDCMSPQSAYNHYAQKKNPKPNVTRDVPRVPQSNQEIIDFVIGKMANTLGKSE